MLSRTVWLRLLACLAILVALPTYLALGARWWWVFDLATHFRFFYACALLPLAAVLCATKRWRLLAWVAVALLIDISWLAPHYLGRTVPDDASFTRIISINVLFNNLQRERVLQLIQQESPDIVLLVEVDPSWQPTLSELASQFPHALAEPRAGSFGIALFSKLPLEDLQVVETGSTGSPSIHATVEIGKTNVRIVGTHFMPPMSSERFQLRNEQLLATAQALAQKPRPCLVLGDMNITPWSPHFRDLLEIGNLCNSQAGFGIQPSWLGAIPIDHLLHSEDIAVLNRRIGPQVGSDHRPLIVDFVVRNAAK